MTESSRMSSVKSFKKCFVLVTSEQVVRKGFLQFGCCNKEDELRVNFSDEIDKEILLLQNTMLG